MSLFMFFLSHGYLFPFFTDFARKEARRLTARISRQSLQRQFPVMYHWYRIAAFTTAASAFFVMAGSSYR
jgi:hypothetical protein